MNINKEYFLLLALGLLTACTTTAVVPATPEAEPKVIDRRSYQLGGINTFAEIVDLGIKKMALSTPLSPSELDDMLEDVERIAADHHVELYRETDFLVTDLYPASLTEGIHVMLIYQGDTLDEYLALKARKAQLVASDEYSGAARKEIAYGMGKLLSYPDSKIEQLIAGSVSDRE